MCGHEDGDVMRELIRIVQAHMDEYGVSEAEIARRIGASPQTVNTWRNGEMKQLPRQQYLQKLAELTKTDYPSVLTAALLDTGYIATPIDGQSDHIASMIELSFLADDLDAAASVSPPFVEPTDPDEFAGYIEEVENYVREVDDLVSAAEYLTEAVHKAVLEAVGGNVGRLRQIKREIRRFNQAKKLKAHGADLLGSTTGEPPPKAMFGKAAARTAPPGYSKGQADQGEAGGDESQVTDLE